MNLVLLLFPTAAASFIFALALGVGRLALRPWRARFDSPLAFHCVAGGIGMAVLAHAVLLLGLLGQWRMGGFIPLGVVFVALALAGFWPQRQKEPDAPHEGENAQELRGRPTPVEVIAWAALSLILVCLALRAITPPANYDVLEYHLGAVQHWLRAERIFPFPHLFYAALPFEVEMWYATGCFLEGNPLLPATPKLICFAVLLCNLATLYALTAALGQRRPFRLLACLIFAVHPLVSVGASDALNDLGVTWFASLAFLTWVHWLNKHERLFFVLCSVFFGLTLCCKYTAAGLIIFPAFLILLPTAFFSPHPSHASHPSHPSHPSRLLAHWALAALILAVVFWPWAFKNARHFGNPVYPLLSGWFPSPTWSPAQTDFYLTAHGRTDLFHAAFWAAFARNLERIGLWLVLAVAAGCAWKKRGVAVAALTAVLAGSIFVHSFFPGNPTRFLLPVLPLAAALATCFIERLFSLTTPLRSAALAPFVFWIGLGTLAAVDPPIFRESALRFERIGLPVFADAPPTRNLLALLFSDMTRFEVLEQALGPAVAESRRFLNEQTPPNSRIFLLYEARIAGLARPVEVASVFDRSPLIERAFRLRSADELFERLRADGFDYLYVNEFELARLIQTYTPRAMLEGVPPLLGPGTDIRDAARYSGLYPPYLEDERFSRCRNVIEEFVERCRRRAIFTLRPDFPYGIWIAPLK